MRFMRTLCVSVCFVFLLSATARLSAQALVANAGPDRTDAIVGTPVNLNGAGSTGAATFAWTFTTRPAGSVATLSGAGTATPSFTPDKGGTYVVKLTVGNGTATATDTVSITTVNHAPVANAGPNQTLAVGKSAVLNGLLSSDPDNDKLTYAWTVVSAPASSLRSILKPTASKTKLFLDRPGTYLVQLIVRDGALSSVADQMTITTLNTRPVANAGPDRIVTLGALAQLDASASSDIDEQELTYQWTLKKPAGSGAVLSDRNSIRPTFTPDVAGAYTLTLSVSDGDLLKTDTVILRTTGNIAPIARAGIDHLSMVAGQTIVLDGSDSTDANGDSLTYAWTIAKKPAASTATLGSANRVRSTFTADVKGKYTFTLTVTDPSAATATDQIAYLKALPVADAGNDRAANTGSPVTLDGSGSLHLTGTLAYGWALISLPAGSAASLSNPADPQPQFTPDLPGTYVAQLIVFDGTALSPADTVVVTVSANGTPQIDLGPDRVTAAPSLVTLDSLGVSDPDGDPVTLRWSLIARPPASAAALTSASAPTTQLNVDVVGAYVVQLIATDAEGLSAVDTVVVTTAQARPIVSAGVDRAITPGTPVNLTATASDPNNDPLTYSWRILSRPEGSGGALATPNTASTSFTPTVSGAYVVQVIVTDDDGMEQIDAVVVRVAPGGGGAPIVTIAASDPNAAETGGNPGTFTFTRTGSLTAALNNVAYTRSGTATAGTDYSPSLPASGTVNFAVGQATTTITITPATDGLAEGAETVILTLSDGAAYDLGAPDTQTATVTIADADSVGTLDDGALLTGSITTTGEVDTWVFTATAGDRIAVHIGEITDTNAEFAPWIRLLSPTGTTLGDTSGLAAAVIDDIIAPATGTYRVLVASADAGFNGTGTYRLTMVHTPGPIVVSGGDQGGPLTNGFMHTGEILQGDVDVWTFSATAGERIAIHIGQTGETDDFRPWIRLWGPTGTSLGDTAGVNGDVIDDVVAPVTGTYLVLVASFDAGFDGEGTYRLTMVKTPGPFTVAPGDDGGALTNGATHTGTIVPGDVDTWTFTATAGQRIALHIGQTAEVDDFRPWIRLWAPNGATLGDTAGLDADVIDDVVAPVTGTYVVLVASFDAGFDGAGSYRMTLVKTPGPITVSAGDQGGPLTNGFMHTGEIVRGDADAWTFTANAGERITVHIGEITDLNDFRPWIRVWAPNGASLGDTAGVDADVLDDIIAPVTGTYLVTVASFDSGFDGEGTYRLTMVHTPGPFTVAPGDDGGALTNGANHTGEIVQGDVDTWTFTATAGDRISLHIGKLTETDDFRPWMRLWAPNNASLGDTAGINADVIDDVIAPVTGTYLVMVASFDTGFDGTGTYRLTMVHTPGPITVSAGDQGGPMTNGSTHTGDITQGDVDVWTFTATAGDRIALHIGQTAETIDFSPWIRLWAPNGATLGDTAGADATVIDDVIAPVTGTYLVLIASFDSGFDGQGSYALTMTHTPGPVTITAGDQGGAITSGVAKTGTILPGDLDVYQINVTAGQHITVSITQTAEVDDFRPWIRLWAPNGATLGDVASLDTALINAAVAPATGRYLILVGSFDTGFNGNGSYSVTVTITP